MTSSSSVGGEGETQSLTQLVVRVRTWVPGLKVFLWLKDTSMSQPALK